MQNTTERKDAYSRTALPPRNVVLHGDCIDILGSLPPASVDFVLTDPPYLVRYQSRDGKRVCNDDNSSWLHPAFAQIFRVLKPGSYCVSFYGWNRVDRFVAAWNAAGFRIVGHVVFRKRYASGGKLLRYSHECAYLLAKGSVTPPRQPIADVIDWKYTGNRLHPLTCFLYAAWQLKVIVTAMHPTFAKLLKGLHPKLEHLITMPPCQHGKMPKTIPKQGVYLFTEGEKHLYVGRSNTIRSRYGRHCNPGATHRMAAFAFKLAREATGKTIASYKAGDDSRKGLMLNTEFRAAFDAAKARIRAMDFRFVEETDQNAQALLEIYCTLALNAKYNDFNTH